MNIKSTSVDKNTTPLGTGQSVVASQPQQSLGATNIVKSTTPNRQTAATAVHHSPQKSTTLNRQYVRKTSEKYLKSAVKQAAIEQFKRRLELAKQREMQIQQQILAKKKAVVMPIEKTLQAQPATVPVNIQVADEPSPAPPSTEAQISSEPPITIQPVAIQSQPTQHAVITNSPSGQTASHSETKTPASPSPKPTAKPTDFQSSPQPHPKVVAANHTINASKVEKRHLSAAELKDQAIKQAFDRVASNSFQPPTKSKKNDKRHFWQSRKFAGILSMSAAAVILVGYLVYLNIPTISIKIAAMNAGIEATYPSYQPNGYGLNGLISYKDGRIDINFSSSNDDFTLSEQKSSWDSVAVFNNYVRPKWGSSYTVAKERGLVIYTNGSQAAWVSGGILYTIDGSSSLTNEQIREIAVSL